MIWVFTLILKSILVASINKQKLFSHTYILGIYNIFLIVWNYEQIANNTIKNNFNPISQGVSIFSPARGGGYLIPPWEIKEGVVLGPMLLKVILKPTKVMITCKILGPYLKNSARYRDLKNLSF